MQNTGLSVRLKTAETDSLTENLVALSYISAQ